MSSDIPSVQSIEYKSLIVKGPFSLKTVEKLSQFWLSSRILLMGPTGSGKSNVRRHLPSSCPLDHSHVDVLKYLETLIGDKSLGISKDQLNGVTQDIVAYELIGVQDRVFTIGQHYLDGTIYLIDTPGFSDDKLSEARIIRKLHDWAEAKRTNARVFGMSISCILYFDRITDTRMSGSKKQTLQLFRQLTGNVHEGVIIVTTMWDMLWNEQQKQRADQRYQQMKDRFWKVILTPFLLYFLRTDKCTPQPYINQKCSITKFLNTQESALEILDLGCTHASGSIYNFESTKGTTLGQAPYGALLTQGLQSRILALQQRKLHLDADIMTHPSQSTDMEAYQQALEERREVEAHLSTLEKDLDMFNPPSTSASSYLKQKLGLGKTHKGNA
ncbi:hypothetical protein CVT24_012789 [Panaeolus cyanescens]|uniref:G domain-containing protein n=1 Tax=Panaeolus cyanescens TaxID=181874 RepID=A0A409W5W5_9AGAR|nr:hypothetical protein CVT24_012789 [Panaeolus cyanescens]